MDARLIKLALILSVFCSLGATYKTPNFIVHAPTEEIAQQVAQVAERSRDELAAAWLGRAMPKWARPCQVQVKVGRIGAGGATTFAFENGHVFGWRMNVQGSLERILDSVVPHEVSHTVFATHFRRPLPRWADEGAATLVEHESERRRQQLLLRQIMQTSRRIPLQKLLSMKEYPREMQNVLTLYAQGYSLADYLVQQGGRARFLAFLEDAHHRGWDRALQSHYGLSNIHDLEKRWDGWVLAGSPRLDGDDAAQLADAGLAGEQPDVVVRSQSPDAGDHADAAGRPGESKVLPPRDHDLRNENRGAGELAAASGASNDRWTPMSKPRLPRPQPLTMRIRAASASAASTSRGGHSERSTRMNPEQHREDPFLPNGSN